MKALVLEKPGSLSLQVAPDAAEPGPGEALVSTRRVGLCGTDLHAYFGRQPFFSYPRVLGHELAVEVERLGPGVEHLEPGARCAVEPYLSCGACGACRRGRTNCCEKLRVLGVHVDGGLRERFVLPAANLHPAPGLSDEALALAETLVIGTHAAARGQVEPRDRVLVVGAGPIGLSAAQAAQARGAEVRVLEREPSRRQRLSGFGLVGAPEPGESAEATESMLRELWGELPDVVVDATGSAASMRASFHYAAQGGRVVFVGLCQGDVAFDDPNFQRRELTLLSSRNGTADDFAQVLGRLQAGTQDARAWITHRLEPGELPERIASLAEPRTGCLKALVSFGS